MRSFDDTLVNNKIERMCDYDVDVLLDVCGLEDGKVIAGAALWTSKTFLTNLGLFTRGSVCEPTELGREVAQVILERRNVRS